MLYDTASWHAVDSTTYYCARTQVESKPWWEVSFGSKYPILLAKISSRSVDGKVTGFEIEHEPIASIPTDLLGLEVSLRNTSIKSHLNLDSNSISHHRDASTCSRVGGTQNLNDTIAYFECDVSSPSSYILVQKTRPGDLRLCQVEAYSEEAKPCGHPGNPRNGLVKINSSSGWPYTPGEVAFYECDDGFVRLPLDPDFHRVCRPDGQWSGKEPLCGEIFIYLLEPGLIQHHQLSTSRNINAQSKARISASTRTRPGKLSTQILRHAHGRDVKILLGL